VGVEILGRFEQAPDAGLVGHPRAVNAGLDHQAFRVHEDVALAPLTFLPPSKPLCSPPTPLVFADWLSTIPALGSGSRPSCPLNRRRIARFILSQVSSILHALK
jgi:hypothetical protein